jgi:hypothetical protein
MSVLKGGFNCPPATNTCRRRASEEKVTDHFGKESTLSVFKKFLAEGKALAALQVVIFATTG